MWSHLLFSFLCIILGVPLLLTIWVLRKVSYFSNNIHIYFVFRCYMVETEIVAQCLLEICK